MNLLGFGRRVKRIFKDGFRLFRWFLWVRIVSVGWALPFEFIGVLVSVAVYYFYTLGLTGGGVLLRGYDPIHYLIIGLFVRSLVNITLPLVYSSVNDLYKGFFGVRGVGMSLADYLRNFRMSIYSFVLANLFSFYIRESLIAVLYLVVGVLFYGLVLPSIDMLLLVMLALVMGSIASLGLSFLVASTIWLTGVLMPQSPLLWFLEVLVSLASGVYFPVDLLPGWLKSFSYFLPHYYCVGAIRSIFAFKSNFFADYAVKLFIYMVASISIGLYVFHESYVRFGKKRPPSPL